MVAIMFATVVLVGSRAAADETGSRATALVVVVAIVFVVGVVFRHLVVPIVRALIRLLERAAELALKIGFGLMVAGAATAVVLVLYAMSALRG